MKTSSRVTSWVTRMYVTRSKILGDRSMMALGSSSQSLEKFPLALLLNAQEILKRPVEAVMKVGLGPKDQDDVRHAHAKALSVA